MAHANSPYAQLNPDVLSTSDDAALAMISPSRLRLVRVLEGVLVLLLLVFVAAIYGGVFGGPTERGYFKGDTSIYFPMHADSVSNAALAVIGFLLPIAVLTGLAAGTGLLKARAGRVRFLRQAMILITVALGLLFVTEGVKLIVGRQRPDFIARCAPDYNLPGVTVDPVSGYVGGNPCTGAAHIVREGRKSFPSGHSSVSFFAAGFATALVTLYGSHVAHVAQFVFGVVMLGGAAFVAVSRSADNRHHPGDIAAGSLLGLLFGVGGVWVFRRALGPRVNQLLPSSV